MDSKPGQQTSEVLGTYMPGLWTAEALEELEALSKRLQKHSTPARLDYEELGGLSDPGQRDCSQAWNILK